MRMIFSRNAHTVTEEFESFRIELRTPGLVAILVLMLSACNAFTDLEDEHGFELSEPTNNTQTDTPDDEPDAEQEPDQPPDSECREPERLEEFEWVEEIYDCLSEIEDTYPDLVFRFEADSDERIFCVDDNRGCYDPDCGDELAECLGVRLAGRNNANNTSPPDLVRFLGCDEAIVLLTDQGFDPNQHYQDATPDTLGEDSFELCLEAATQVALNYDGIGDELATQEALEYACREGLFQCF